jgi:hypothetical protein
MSAHARRTRIAAIAAAGALALVSMAAPARAQEQQEENFCGITPQSARSIAAEIMRQAGYPYDSISAAYYVSVLAPRLSPFYVVFFMRRGFVVGEIEVDMCGRQDTPHPGVQYSEKSDLRADSLLLEPDLAFARLKKLTGAEAVFASRVFPYGLTGGESGWGGADFWWLMLDDQAQWHYMSKVGEMIHLAPRGHPAPPADSTASPGKP